MAYEFKIWLNYKDIYGLFVIFGLFHCFQLICETEIEKLIFEA